MYKLTNCYLLIRLQYTPDCHSIRRGIPLHFLVRLAVPMAAQRTKLVLQDLFCAVDVSLDSSDSINTGLQAALVRA